MCVTRFLENKIQIKQKLKNTLLNKIMLLSILQNEIPNIFNTSSTNNKKKSKLKISTENKHHF